MKTIEERAEQYADKSIGVHYMGGGLEEDLWNATYNRYLEIAKEQQQIDIERACENFCIFANCHNIDLCNERREKLKDNFRCTSYIEFCKAMKGE